MIYTIENKHVRVQVSALGAELQSFYNKQAGIEYMWNADPLYWAKKSPVLFPIVGTLKDNTYSFKGKSYKLGRHGFAREKEFILKEQSDNHFLFTITNDDNTLQVYPFLFEFSIRYSLSATAFSVTYIVRNTGDKAMYFSVGGHPAFKVPLADGEAYTDYFLKFNKKENAGRWPIATGGLIEQEPVPMLTNSDTIPLRKELFYKDAIVFKKLESDIVKLLSAKSNNGISFNFGAFPYLGIWAAKDAGFICIEPWSGIADSVTADQDFTSKEGINQIAPGEIWQKEWSVSIID